MNGEGGETRALRPDFPGRPNNRDSARGAENAGSRKQPLNQHVRHSTFQPVTVQSPGFTSPAQERKKKEKGKQSPAIASHARTVCQWPRRAEHQHGDGQYLVSFPANHPFVHRATSDSKTSLRTVAAEPASQQRQPEGSLEPHRPNPHSLAPCLARRPPRSPQPRDPCLEARQHLRSPRRVDSLAPPRHNLPSNLNKPAACSALPRRNHSSSSSRQADYSGLRRSRNSSHSRLEGSLGLRRHSNSSSRSRQEGSLGLLHSSSSSHSRPEGCLAVRPRIPAGCCLSTSLKGPVCCMFPVWPSPSIPC